MFLKYKDYVNIISTTLERMLDMMPVCYFSKEVREASEKELCTGYEFIHYVVTLVGIVAMNALVLAGKLPSTVGLSINAGIGGFFALMNIFYIKRENGELNVHRLLFILASLVIAASGLVFAHLLSVKAAAGLAIGGIFLHPLLGVILPLGMLWLFPETYITIRWAAEV